MFWHCKYAHSSPRLQDVIYVCVKHAPKPFWWQLFRIVNFTYSLIVHGCILCAEKSCGIRALFLPLHNSPKEMSLSRRYIHSGGMSRKRYVNSMFFFLRREFVFFNWQSQKHARVKLIFPNYKKKWKRLCFISVYNGAWNPRVGFLCPNSIVPSNEVPPSQLSY